MTHVIPVRTICAIYGLNPNTLRSWERRYGIVSPVRSDGGHRGYTSKDVDAIELMLRYMSEGKSASDAAEAVLAELAGRQSAPSAFPDKEKLCKEIAKSVERLDAAGALNASRAAVEAFGYKDAVEQVLFPELARRGEIWDRIPGGIAREHLASLVVRFVIMQHQLEVVTFDADRTVTMACAPGEGHDMPLLHTANLLFEAGDVAPLILAAGLPLEEVIHASHAAGSKFILVSATMTPRSTTLREWIDLIVKSGWEERTLLAGPGFEMSRVFSETRLKAAPGDYSQVVTLFKRLMQPIQHDAH